MLPPTSVFFLALAHVAGAAALTHGTVNSSSLATRKQCAAVLVGFYLVVLASTIAFSMGQCSSPDDCRLWRTFWFLQLLFAVTPPAMLLSDKIARDKRD